MFHRFITHFFEALRSKEKLGNANDEDVDGIELASDDEFIECT